MPVLSQLEFLWKLSHKIPEIPAVIFSINIHDLSMLSRDRSAQHFIRLWPSSVLACPAVLTRTAARATAIHSPQRFPISLWPAVSSTTLLLLQPVSFLPSPKCQLLEPHFLCTDHSFASGWLIASTLTTCSFTCLLPYPLRNEDLTHPSVWSNTFHRQPGYSCILTSVFPYAIIPT